MTALIIDDQARQCLDAGLHATMEHAGRLRVTHLDGPLPDVAVRQLGTTLPIVDCRFHHSYRHFIYDESKPPMVDMRTCLVCETPMVAVLGVASERGTLHLTLGLCPRCGFVQHIRRPSRAFYSDLYRTVWDPAKQDRSAWPQTIGARKDILEQVADLIPAQARVLELGTGWGQSLVGFHMAGHTCVGIEAASHRAAFVNERLGLPCAVGESEAITIGEGPFQPESFDLIYSFHVLEHVYDPRQVLTHTRQLLKPDGLMYVNLPRVDAENLTCNVQDLSHTCSFSLANLVGLMESVGFTIVRATAVEGGICVIGRKATPAAPAAWADRLAQTCQTLPLSNLAYVMEMAGLGVPVPATAAGLRIEWLLATGLEPRGAIYLDMIAALPPLTCSAITALQDGIRAGHSLSRLARWLPLRLAFPVPGGMTRYY